MNIKIIRKLSEFKNKGFKGSKKKINKEIRTASNKGRFRVKFYSSEITNIDAIITYYKNKKYDVKIENLYDDGRENNPIFSFEISW